MKPKTFVAGIALSLAVLTGSAYAWDQIGVREVRERVERDTIVVEGARRFERIRLCAYRNPVHILDMDVHFANGGHQDVSLRERINPGQCSRAINLEGDDRNIRSVTMVYEETSARRRTATVRLLAE